MGEFTKNITITFVTRVLTLVVGLTTSIIIARVLGPEGKGVYSLVTLLPSLIVTITCLGIGPATVYYIGRKAYPSRQIFGNNIIISLIIGIFSVIIGFIIIFFFSDPVFSGIPHRYLLLALGLIPFTLFFDYVSTVFLGLQRFKKYNLSCIIHIVLFLTLVAIVLFVFRAGILGVISARIVSSFLVCVLLFIWAKHLVDGISFQPNKSYIKSVSIYGTKAQLSNVLAFLHLRLDIFLISAFLNPLAVGYYSVAVGLTEQLWLVSQSASTILFPKVASERNEKCRKEFTPLVSRNTIFITAIGALAIFFLSRWIIILFFSEAYLPATRPLQILLIGTVAVSGSRVLANDFAGRGRPMLNTYLNALSTTINLCLNILWIPRFGINGAAWATTVSYTAALVGTLLFYNRISGNSLAKTIFVQKSDIILYKRALSSVMKWVNIS